MLDSETKAGLFQSQGSGQGQTTSSQAVSNLISLSMSVLEVGTSASSSKCKSS